MNRPTWRGAAWWVEPALWETGTDEEGIHRPTEALVFARIRRQAQVRRRPLLRVVVMLERWYHDYHPEVIPFVRLQLIARRLDMTVYQVGAALHEAERLLEMGAL